MILLYVCYLMIILHLYVLFTLSLTYIFFRDVSDQRTSTHVNAVITRKRVRRGDGRKRSRRPEGMMTVTSISKDTGAPFEPEEARIKFSTLCGIVARE